MSRTVCARTDHCDGLRSVQRERTGVLEQNCPRCRDLARDLEVVGLHVELPTCRWIGRVEHLEVSCIEGIMLSMSTSSYDHHDASEKDVRGG